MPEYCSCGTQLVEDALFCHKCGRPTREIVMPEPVPPPPPIAPIPPPRVQGAPVNFRNGAAMRVALLVAVVATVLSPLTYLDWLAAGFFAVFFYRRRTGYPLNMESGVRMGWITGLLMFGILAALLSLMVFFLRSAGGMAAMQAEFKNAMDPRIADTMKLLQSNPEVVKLLLQLFVFTTLLSMAGGALGAKLVGRN